MFNNKLSLLRRQQSRIVELMNCAANSIAGYNLHFLVVFNIILSPEYILGERENQVLREKDTLSCEAMEMV